MRIISLIFLSVGIALGASLKVQYIDLGDYGEIIYNNAGDGFVAYNESDSMSFEISSNANVVVYVRDNTDTWSQLGNTIIETNQYVYFDDAIGFDTNFARVVAATMSSDSQTVIVNNNYDNADYYGTPGAENGVYGSRVYKLTSNEWTEVFSTTSHVEQVTVSGDGSMFIEKDYYNNMEGSSNAVYRIYKQSGPNDPYEVFDTISIAVPDYAQTPHPYVNMISFDGNRFLMTDDIATNYCKVFELESGAYQVWEDFSLDSNVEDVWGDPDLDNLVVMSETNIVIWDIEELTFESIGLISENSGGNGTDTGAGISTSFIGLEPVRFIAWMSTSYDGSPSSNKKQIFSVDQLGQMMLFNEIREVDDISIGEYDMYNYGPPEYLYGPTIHGSWEQNNSNMGAGEDDEEDYLFYTLVPDSSSASDNSGLVLLIDDLQQTITTLSNELLSVIQNNDVALQNNIDVQEANRLAENSNLQSNIDTEGLARLAGDTVLQSNIDAATRIANNTTLQNNITAEAAARIADDATLQSNIDTEAATRLVDDSSIIAAYQSADINVRDEFTSEDIAIRSEFTAADSAMNTVLSNSVYDSHEILSNYIAAVAIMSDASDAALSNYIDAVTLDINADILGVEQIQSLLISSLNLEIQARIADVDSLESEIEVISNIVEQIETTSNGYSMAEAQAMMRDLRVGSSTISVSNGTARISLTVDESNDLTESWSATEHSLEMDIPAVSNTTFYRFRMD